MAEVQDAGVTIEAEEAVAIAQQLIAGLRNADNADVVGPPFGPPTLANVYLAPDGSVVCRGCETIPAVFEMAIFLEAMVPAKSVRVPGGLRYAIARALLDVDVPPFDSLDDFAETLTRYERGPRDQIVRSVLHRLDARRALVPVHGADRRRHPHATQLRRALREADARLYLQKLAADAMPVAVSPPQTPHPRRIRAAAACIAAGLLLVVTGEFIDGWHSPRPSPAPLAAATRVVARDIALGPDERRTVNRESQPSRASKRPALVERRTLAAGRRAPNSEPRSPSVKRASSPVGRAQQSRVSAPRRSPRMLDRLRLNWLRTVFASS